MGVANHLAVSHGGLGGHELSVLERACHGTLHTDFAGRPINSANSVKITC